MFYFKYMQYRISCIDMKVNIRRCFQTESLKILIVNPVINNKSSSVSFERSSWDNERQRLSRRCGMGTCYWVTRSLA